MVNFADLCGISFVWVTNASVSDVVCCVSTEKQRLTFFLRCGRLSDLFVLFSRMFALFGAVLCSIGTLKKQQPTNTNVACLVFFSGSLKWLSTLREFFGLEFVCNILSTGESPTGN